MLHNLNGDVENEALQVRIRKGAEYFADKLYDVRELIENTQIDIDNAATNKRITTTRSDLLLQVRLHIKLLEIAADEGFTTSSYLQNRAKILLQIEESSNTKSSTNQKMLQPRAQTRRVYRPRSKTVTCTTGSKHGVPNVPLPMAYRPTWCLTPKR